MLRGFLGAHARAQELMSADAYFAALGPQLLPVCAGACVVVGEASGVVWLHTWLYAQLLRARGGGLARRVAELAAVVICRAVAGGSSSAVLHIMTPLCAPLAALAGQGQWHAMHVGNARDALGRRLLVPAEALRCAIEDIHAVVTARVLDGRVADSLVHLSGPLFALMRFARGRRGVVGGVVGGGSPIATAALEILAVVVPACDAGGDLLCLLAGGVETVVRIPGRWAAGPASAVEFAHGDEGGVVGVASEHGASDSIDEDVHADAFAALVGALASDAVAGNFVVSAMREYMGQRGSDDVDDERAAGFEMLALSLHLRRRIACLARVCEALGPTVLRSGQQVFSARSAEFPSHVVRCRSSAVSGRC